MMSFYPLFLFSRLFFGLIRLAIFIKSTSIKIKRTKLETSINTFLVIKMAKTNIQLRKDKIK